MRAADNLEYPLFSSCILSLRLNILLWQWQVLVMCVVVVVGCAFVVGVVVGADVVGEELF